MLETPERDEEGIILDFMQGHYGPAAKPMIEFLDYLRKCVREQKEPMFYMANFKHYQTADFMGKAYRLLHQARQMTKPDSQYRLRVEKEMIAPLGVLLSHRGMDIGIPRDKLKAEYISYRKGQIERYCFPEKRKKLLKELEDSLIDIPIPDQFKEFPEDKIRVLAYPSFPQLKADSEAVLGKAMLISYSLSSDRQHLMKKVKGHYPTSFGLYDWQDKRGIDFTIPMPPDDEKYHWYKIGDFEIGSATALWGWWWLSRVNVATVYDNADGLPPGHNRWTVWIHIKVTGPAYVAGSTMENEILMDQIVLHK